MKSCFTRFLALLAITAINMLLATESQADPLLGRDLLKFSQQPMNTTFIVNTTGQVGIYKGHDELSTAYGFTNNPASPPTSYDGKFMADDFADRLTSPVVHVKWWGSYRADFIDPATPVNKFLIAFEADVPAPVPGFSTPGAVLQSDVVGRTTNPLTPGSGQFTEKLIRGPDSILNESLYEYNAELHFGHEFFEQKDTVYWLKIAALVDVVGLPFPQPDSPYAPPPTVTQWGWHNRDYTISDANLASTAVSPGETVSTNPADGASVWHFQDDAVQGDLRFAINPPQGTPNFGIVQNNMVPTNYVGGGVDGPGSNMPGAIGIQNFSKDLAFNLYTLNPPIVPEPTTCLLLVCGSIGFVLSHRRRRG